jgi:hypothetical protein
MNEKTYSIELRRSQLAFLIAHLRIKKMRSEALLSLPPDKSLPPQAKGLEEAELRANMEILRILERVVDW